MRAAQSNFPKAFPSLPCKYAKRKYGKINTYGAEKKRWYGMLCSPRSIYIPSRDIEVEWISFIISLSLFFSRLYSFPCSVLLSFLLTNRIKKNSEMKNAISQKDMDPWSYPESIIKPHLLKEVSTDSVGPLSFSVTSRNSINGSVGLQMPLASSEED